MKKTESTLFTFMFLLCGFSFAQEIQKTYEETEITKVRPVRIGLKIGVPNLIGGNLEYVTPLLEDRLALNVDYSTIKSGWFISDEESGEDKLDFNYWEAGVNYYFFKPGKGLYGNLSYGSMSFEGVANEIESENDPSMTGTANIDYNNNSFNIKLGAKLGGLFYFRPEIGYSFSSLPETVEIVVNMDDGSTEHQEYNVKEFAGIDLLFSGFMVNIGFGFAF